MLSQAEPGAAEDRGAADRGAGIERDRRVKVRKAQARTSGKGIMTVADNTLTEGRPRLGWFVDGDPDTPHIAVMLEDTGRQIVLTVPVRDFGDGPYTRWFTEGAQYADDPDRRKYSYRPPRTLMFEDPSGSVVLVGCVADDGRSNLSVGNGRIIPNFAVLGGRNLGYDHINGLRSEISGLSAWTDVKSMMVTPRVDSQGRVQEVDVHLEAAAESRLARAMNLTLRPTWRTTYPDDAGTLSAHDVVQLQTHVTKPASWDDHLSVHEAIRELLALSSWQRVGFSSLAANRLDDPERFMSGDVIRPRWAEVRTHLLRTDEEWTGHPQFLFGFSDIATAGIHRWLKLRTQFRRAMQPLTFLADQRVAHWDVRIVQSGIALEALGHELACEGGLRRGKQITYNTALDHIIDTLVFNPLIDTEQWKKQSKACFMGIKHADRTTPDALTIANTYRENLLVARFWLAGRLGTNSMTLRGRRAADPHASEYFIRE